MPPFEPAKRITVIGGRKLSKDSTDLMERVLIHDGYVLNFSDRTIAAFFQDFGVDIADNSFKDFGPSKGNRLRSFLAKATPDLAGRVLTSLLAQAESASPEDVAAYQTLVSKLMAGSTPGPTSYTGPSLAASGPTGKFTPGPLTFTMPNPVPTFTFPSPTSPSPTPPSPKPTPTPTPPASGYRYQLALSYAGEDQNAAQSVAEGCRAKGISIFYAPFEKANLWGKDDLHYTEVYEEQCRHCIVFVSEHYATKIWPAHEFRAVRARAMREKEYILPIRLDSSKLPGLLHTVGYVDWHTTSVAEILDLIEEKLRS